MHFAQVLFAVVGIASVSAAPLSVRTAATVESDISTILADLQSLDGKVKSFDGGIISGISFLSAYNSLRGSITSATTTVNSTGTLSAADSATIVTGLTPVVAEVQVVTTDLIAKASTVSGGGFTSQVLSALKTLKGDTDAFFTTLAGTVDATTTANVTADGTTCDTALSSAIAAY